MTKKEIRSEVINVVGIEHFNKDVLTVEVNNLIARANIDFAEKTECVDAKGRFLSVDDQQEYDITNLFSHIHYVGLSGNFQINEVVTCSSASSASFVVEKVFNDNRIAISRIGGTIATNELMTGGTSGATASTSGTEIKDEVAVINRGEYDGEKVKWLNYEEITNFSADDRADSSTYAYLYERERIGFIPIPSDDDEVVKLKGKLIPSFDSLKVDTNVPRIPVQYHPALIDFVLAKLFRRPPIKDVKEAREYEASYLSYVIQARRRDHTRVRTHPICVQPFEYYH